MKFKLLALLMMLCVSSQAKTNYDKKWITEAYKLLPQYKREVEAIHTLIMYESGNAPSRHKRNRRSTAYGLGQFLDSTWKGTGVKKTDNGIKQIAAMIIYCNKRYGSAAKALIFWRRNKWY